MRPCGFGPQYQSKYTSEFICQHIFQNVSCYTKLQAFHFLFQVVIKINKWASNIPKKKKKFLFLSSLAWTKGKI